ncbi:MAG: hypothetical protein KAT05_05630 [Spirochaetes bacterium]|nr:hypothetical protein [Spirochaetota bacterium]
MDLKIIDDYIELKNLQIKYTPFEIIDLGYGHIFKKTEESVKLEFIINKYIYNTVKKGNGYFLKIYGKIYNCDFDEINENHIIINVHGLIDDTENYKAELLNDMSFIYKKQKEVLEEFKSDKHSVLRGQLFGNGNINGGNVIEIINKNDELNDLQNTAVSYGLGVDDLFLIWGPPGTGKTTLVPEIAKNYCEIWKKADSKTPKILLCAWTNTAVDNVVKKLKKENYNVIRYGKGTKLDDKEYILYETQEKKCKEKIEKKYELKLNSLESEKKETKERLKENEIKVPPLENKISGFKNESTKLVGELQSKLNVNVERLQDKLKSILETEKSVKQNQLINNNNELKSVTKKYKGTITFIEDLSKTIKQYEIEIDNFEKEIITLNYQKEGTQDNLNIANEYLFFIGNRKLKYLAYRIGLYSPPFLFKLKKYGLHKQEYTTVSSNIIDLDENIISLNNSLSEAISNKKDENKLKSEAEKYLDENEQTKNSLEIKKNQLKGDIKNEKHELDILLKNLRSIEKIHKEEIPNIENYLNLTYVTKFKDDLFNLINTIKEFQLKIINIEKEYNSKIQENEIKIKIITDIILNISKELFAIDNQINKLENEKSIKLDNKTALIFNCYDVIATTIYETSKIFNILDFDLTIIDEAGAVEVPSALIPMIHSKKIILLGDHKQLPPIIKDSNIKIRNFLEEHPELRISIFELLYNKVGLIDNCTIMLEMQYRMQKKIAEFISKIFYENKLDTFENIKTELKDGDDEIISKDKQLIWFLRDYWIKECGRSKKCIPEVKLIKNIVNNFKKCYGDKITKDIAIISPYKCQKDEIENELPDIEVGTVHKYQGQDKKIIIFSTAESNNFGPLFTGKNGEKLLNVAVSRAEEKFIIIGSEKIKKIPHYGLLYKHIARNGRVFDEIVDDYDPNYTCPECGKVLYNLNYEFCFECGQIKKLPDPTFPEKRNIKCKDSDLVRSSGEVRVDDWLFDNGIEHRCEVKLPISTLLYCDWYLPKYDIYIEFWGSVHSKDGGAHRKYKEKVYKNNGLKLINIDNEDLNNLNEILDHKIGLKLKSKKD